MFDKGLRLPYLALCNIQGVRIFETDTAGASRHQKFIKGKQGALLRCD